MNRLLILAGIVLLAGCKDDCDDDMNPVTDNSRMFRVQVENVSTTTTLEPGAMPDRSVPLSHGVWAVYNAGSLFTVDQQSDEGTSRIAEDGVTTVKTNELNMGVTISSNGEFVAPGGPDNGAAIFMGESSTFTFEAKPGDKLQIQSMFVQSNDWFYAFRNGGLPLFLGSTPVSGNVTSELLLYDAGTEADELPGMGSTQKPDQAPLDINIGPADSVNKVTVATQRHSSFIIPPTSGVIKITVTPL